MIDNYLLPDIIKRARTAQNVIIAGAFSTGKELCSSLKESGIQASAFFDNNIKLYNQKIDGVPVVPFTRLNTDSCLYIIASVNFHDEIRAQLLKLGIKQEEIMDYYPVGSYEYEYNKRVHSPNDGSGLSDNDELIVESELNLSELERYAEKLYYRCYGRFINWRVPSLLDEKLNCIAKNRLRIIGGYDIDSFVLDMVCIKENKSYKYY